MGAEPGADELGGGHDEAVAPQDMAAREEEEQGGEVAGEVEELGVGGGAAEVVAQQGDIANGEEAAGAGAKKAVVKADGQGDQEGEGALTQALVGVEVRDAGGEEEIEAEGDEEGGYQPGGQVAADLADEEDATGGAYEGAAKGQGRPVEVDETLAQEIGAGGGSAEDALGLVGSQGLQGPQAGPEQGRQGNEPAAARDGVHQTRGQGQDEEEYFGFHGLGMRNLD